MPPDGLRMLVMLVTMVTDLPLIDRRQVEEGQAELSCLEERNSSLQQDVLRLEETLQNKT